MHQHSMSIRELGFDQRCRPVERHDTLRQERHVNSLRRFALRQVGQHSDNRAVELLRVLQIADEQTVNNLALLPTRRHVTVQLDGLADIASTSGDESATTAYRRTMVR